VVLVAAVVVVAVSAAVRTMIVGDHSAIAFPTNAIVLSADVIRLDPVRALI
jgi:hypothetical protein